MRCFGLATVALLLTSYACTSSHSASDDEGTPGGEEQVTRVQVVRPERQDLVRTISLPGNVEAFEQAKLYAMAAGYLKSIYVDKGDRVRKGQILAELEIPEMVKEEEGVEARLTEARTSAQLRKFTFERLATVREKEPEVISQQELDVARAEMERAAAAVAVAEANQAKLAAMMNYGVLRAPFPGVVTERFVDPGALIQTAAATRQATPVVTVMNMSVVRVYVHVPESQVAYVQNGTPASMEIDALPGRRFENKVARFASALDPTTRTMKVEIDVPNSDGALLHGMYGNVTLTLREREQALTVPADSVLQEGDKKYVFAVQDDLVTPREVTTGLHEGQVVEILTGLEGEERVVIGDTSALHEGMTVRVAR